MCIRDRRCTFTCYAIETILTTNRTDSLQYTALIAAYKAYPPYVGSNSVPLALYASCYPMRYRVPDILLFLFFLLFHVLFLLFFLFLLQLLLFLAVLFSFLLLILFFHFPSSSVV